MRAAVAFLTIVGGSAKPDDRTMGWFPLVGALLGLALGGVWWAGGEVWMPVVAASVVVAADLAFTGMLHIDGLADSADGLLAPLGSVERRLTVMADPVTGAFGVAAVAATLLLRTAGLASVAPEPLALVALWCTSRTVMAVAALRMPYARTGGLASDFVGPDSGRLAVPVAAGGTLVACSSAYIGAGATGLAAVAATVAGGATILWLAYRRIAGYTGDVLGAAAVIGETVGLIALGTRW